MMVANGPGMIGGPADETDVTSRCCVRLADPDDDPGQATPCPSDLVNRQFNNRRLLEPIGNIPPAEAEQRWRDEQEQAAIVA